MENIFTNSSYDVILKNWYELRNKLKTEDLQTICIEVDNFWQRVPLVNHYLHSDFVEDWPNPWELLAENHYCNVARGLGMFYTLHLLGINNIDFVEALDHNNDSVALLLVDNAKYILNYWPNTVVNNYLRDFKNIKHIDTEKIITKIGLK